MLLMLGVLPHQIDALEWDLLVQDSADFGTHLDVRDLLDLGPARVLGLIEDLVRLPFQ